MKLGLSLKQLGRSEYDRLRYLKVHGTRKNKTWWTGLSTKLLSHAEYMAQWRKLRAAKNTH